MVANTSPIFELAPVSKGVQFTSADTTAKKSICTGGTNGTRIDQIPVSSNDTAAINLAFYINDVNGANVDIYIGNVVVAISAGYLAVARVDAMTTLSPTLGYLALPVGAILKAACVATMTAAKTCDVNAMGGDF